MFSSFLLRESLIAKLISIFIVKVIKTYYYHHNGNLMEQLKKQFLKFIADPNFPCIGARATAKNKSIDILIAEDLNSPTEDTQILVMLYKFIRNWKKYKDHLQTACIIYKTPHTQSEKQFEESIWNRLQKLHELDCEIYPWDATVSPKVSDPTFSYSIGGQAFFVVGLHANSSRKARQFKYPTLIFNLHAQFELIRNNNIYEKMRDKIRESDLLYSGSINPMVEDFGAHTEAIQYSGRHVPSSHLCPFKMNAKLHENWHTIEPCSGKGFILKKNDFLVVEDFMGEQVADLFCFSENDVNEFLSSGRSIDYNNTIAFTTSHKLFSNKSNIMLSIIMDEVGQHDFLFSPCNKETFRILYDNKNPPSGCYEHLIDALSIYGIKNESITTTFNIFMNVSENPLSRQLDIGPPKSKKGERIIFKSHMNLIVGLTACSAPKSNNFSLKPIRYKIISGQ